MDNIQVSELQDDLDKFRRNPNAVQRSVYKLLDKASKGTLNVIDPTNPFTLLLESAAVMAADSISECESLTRRTYPKLVSTEDDLYGHISDLEYVGVWGSPSRDLFTFAFNVAELRSLAKTVPGTNNTKLVIPRESRVTVAGANFSFVYPIEIIFSGAESISILYDTSEQSPFMALETNVIDYRLHRHQGSEMLMFQVPGLQYSVESSVATVSSASGFSTTKTIRDYLYYCRVFHRHTGGDWEEMVTTHSGRVYDNGIPTATLKLADGTLRVKIPEIYFNKGLIGAEVRIDVYTTKGNISLSLSEYPYTAVQSKWIDLNNTDNGRYTAPLSQITQMAIAGSSVTKGGSNGLSFEELQDRTVRNSTYKPAPVTEFDLTNTLKDRGYDVLSVVDNITDRTFLASRTVPAPERGLSSSPIGTTVESIKVWSELLQTLSTAYYANKIWSIMPNTLYKRNGVGISFVSDLEREALEQASGDVLISLLEQESYFFSPYLTVLDTNDDVFSYNNYYIDNPTVNNRYFGAANSKVDYKATLSAMSLYRTFDGYELAVTVKGSVGHEKLHPSKVGLQLAFRPGGQEQRTYVEGVNYGRDVDGNLIFRFPINTKFEIHKGHKLFATNFNAVIDDTLLYPIEPDTEFDFIHYVTDVGLSTDKRDDLHNLLGTPFAAEDAIVITHETANLRLFESMDGLINRSRVSINEPNYEVWDRDVPMLYSEDIYEREPDSGFIKLVEVDGQFEGILLHSKGDPVMDSETGGPVYQFRQGDYKLDEHGERIPVGGSSETYFIEQILFDGRYRYSTETGTNAYVRTVAESIVDWVQTDIGDISGKLLARTDLMFSPKANSGTITVYSVQGEPKQISAGISVRVDLYVSFNAYSNAAIRKSLNASVKEVVINELAKSKISTGSIHDKLRKVVSDDVVTIKVHSFNDDSTLDAFVVDNDSVGCSLAKVLERQPDGAIALVDDLDIKFIRHTD
ncbi:MAG: hypothetical protein CMO01_04045 [Thalassobius sp.]|nr:hypothetical protein [Thalassovita sp.]|tara:strand:- start:128534 stop:131443 length:2910 start_codon:yes stop_codon:yes gene_type:complete